MRRIVVTVGTTASAVALLVSYATSTHRPASMPGGTALLGATAAGTTSAAAITAAGTPTTGEATDEATDETTAASTSTSTPSATATPTPSAKASAKASASPKASAKASPTPKAAVTKAAPAGVSGTFNGATAQTQFGPVQVQIVVKNNKITSANAIQYPTGNSRDVMIASYAVPTLNSEAVQAQSANISMVSGATYTSNGYLQSLQSALNQARL